MVQGAFEAFEKVEHILALYFLQSLTHNWQPKNYCKLDLSKISSKNLLAISRLLWIVVIVRRWMQGREIICKLFVPALPSTNIQSGQNFNKVTILK